MRILDDKGKVRSTPCITSGSAKAAALVRVETDAIKINPDVSCSIKIVPDVSERLSDLHSKLM
jgi:capsule polysaccharide export protein KpsC/LpsZ